jgi:hypothetical protein
MDRVADIVQDSFSPFNEIVKNYKTVTNIMDVHNSTLLTLNDVVSYIYRNPQSYQYNIIGDSLTTPFEDRFDNTVAGWAIDMNVAVGNPNDMCVINLNVDLAEGVPTDPCS